MLDAVFLRILDMTRTGTLVILAVLLARLLLKRAPKVFAYALWAVALFRLLCPVTFEAPVSLLPESEPVSQSYDLAEEPISVVGAGIAAYQVVGDAINVGLGIQHVPTTERNAWGNVQYVTTDWWNVVLLFGQYLWLVGVAGMLLYGLLSYWKLRAKLKTAVPFGERLWLADGIGSPFVIGFIHPKIYLPEGLGEKEREYILLHEREHIRRGDPLIKLLAWFALCLHWFNPLVWLAFVLACRDMEMSCDEAVLKKLGGDIRADYAASLLSLATGRRIIAGTPLAFGEGDPKGRIKNLARWKKPAFWVLLAAGIGCTVLGICLIADPASGEDDILMGANYSVDRTLYDVTEGERDTFRQITVTADYQLYRQLSGADYWLSGRNMESYPLTEKELKQYTGADSGWKENYRIGKISDAYIVPLENDHFYLVFRTGRGDTLFGFGWEDVSERNDPGSDDTNLLWLCRLEPEPFEGEALLNFIARSLLAPVGATECVDLWETEKNPGYLIAGFLADPHSPEEYHDMGYAVFQRSSAGCRLLRYHVYDEAALAENGIFFCNHPAVLSLDGTATDENSFDVILSVNPSLSKISREYYKDDTLVHTSTAQPLAAPSMSLFAWDECPEANRVRQYYLSKDGSVIEDTGALLTENRLAEGVYIPTECLYMNPLSSYFPHNLSEDFQYTVTKNGFVTRGILLQDGVELLSVDWRWQTLQEAGAALDFLKETGHYETLVREDCLYQELDATRCILQSGGRLYLIQHRDSLWYIFALEPEKDADYISQGNTLRERIGILFTEVSASPAQYSMPGPYIEAHPEQWQALISYGSSTLEYCFSEFTASGQKGILELLMALACEEILKGMGEQGFPAVEGHGTGSQWFHHFAEYAQLLIQTKENEEVEKYHPGAWLYLQMRAPGMGFVDLAPDATEYFPVKFHFSEDGGSVYYTLTYNSPASILEIGLLGENGRVFTQIVEDGHINGTFPDIPAGSYRFYVSNVGYVNGLPGKAVSGAVNCTLHGGMA